MYSVYILFSAHLGKFYIGYSGNVPQRLAHHNSLEYNRIWTRRGIPWEVYLTIEGLSRSEALRIEKHIKSMKSADYIKALKEDAKLIKKLKERYVDSG